MSQTGIIFDRDDIGIVRGTIGAITPDDVNYLPRACRVLTCTGAGNIAVRFADGSTGTIDGVTTGWNGRVEGEFVQVLNTGTTATGVKGYY